MKITLNIKGENMKTPKSITLQNEIDPKTGLVLWNGKQIDPLKSID